MNAERMSAAEWERRARASYERAQERRVRASQQMTWADYLCRAAIVVGVAVVCWLTTVVLGGLLP